MEIIRINKNVEFIDDLVCCIGQFDGIHVAHQALIKKTLEIGKERNLKTGLITFDPHPDFVINKSLRQNYLTPLEDKISIISSFGLDYLIIIHFDDYFMSLKKEEFVLNYLVKMGLKEAVVGFDFSFGLYGNGKAFEIEPLSNGKIKTIIIEEIKYKNDKVGSTLIKELLSNGDVVKVDELLGHPYSIVSNVIRGDGIGKFLGFPTANLDFDMSYVGLKIGVYSVLIEIEDKVYKGLCNYGYNPSLNALDKPRLEVFIKDFEGNLYDKKIKISFLNFIRDEIKFSNKEDLIIQINKDLKLID